MNPHIPDNSAEKKKFWFKSKTYGYGWQPATWQGWVVLLGFTLFEIANLAFRYDWLVAPTLRDMNRFVFDSFILVGLLIFVCAKTGETPRWQWGKKSKSKHQIV
jgi:hypothetical protein